MAQSGERIGSTIAGFEVEAPVGVGGMGAVYLARDPTLKRRVALKVVAPALADDPRYRTRFLREAELAASLDHPAIVPVYAAGESDGDLYLAMRYVEGGSLADRLLADGRLEPERATALLAPVAAALDAAHAAGLAHRDVKPGNILLDGDHAYLADFGLARPTTATASAPATAAGLRGTVGYLAPEQLEGQPASPQADQYALACVLFECLTGRRPFERENDIAVVYAHHTEAPPGVTSLAAGLPKEIDAVVARGLAKRPADRFRSCGELIEAAARACGVRVDAHGGVHRRRRSMFVGAIAGAAVAALAGLGALLVPGTRSVEAAVVAAPSDPVVVIDGTTGSIVGRIDAGSSPSRIAIGADAAWVLNADVRTVTRIDLETLEPGQPFAVVGDPVDLAVGVTPLDRAAGAPAVWVATGTGAAGSSAGTGTLADTVVPVDPSTLAPLGRVAARRPGCRGRGLRRRRDGQCGERAVGRPGRRHRRSDPRARPRGHRRRARRRGARHHGDGGRGLGPRRAAVAHRPGVRRGHRRRRSRRNRGRARHRRGRRRRVGLVVGGRHDLARRRGGTRAARGAPGPAPRGLPGLRRR